MHVIDGGLCRDDGGRCAGVKRHLWSGPSLALGPSGDSPEGKTPDTAFNLPPDTFWMLGHDGQSVAIVLSKKLVIVRFGLTPFHLHYKPQAMLAAVITALE